MSTIAGGSDPITASQAAPERKRAAWSAHLLVASLILYAAVNLADLLSTYIGLQHGLREGNPLMGHLLAMHGFIAVVAYKTLVVAVVSVGVLALRKSYPRVAHLTVVACNVLVASAVLLNVLQFLSL